MHKGPGSDDDTGPETGEPQEDPDWTGWFLENDPYRNGGLVDVLHLCHLYITDDGESHGPFLRRL